MNPKTTMITLFVLGVLAGAFTFASLGSQFGFGLAGSPPSGHQAVAEQVQINDNTYGSALSAVFVRSGETRTLSIVQLQSIPQEIVAELAFTGNVQYSVWEYRLEASDGATVVAVMTVWGPGDQGEYFCELGRLSANAYSISYPGGSFSWPQGSNVGFVYFQYAP
ncbi:MAG: hypothetical protein WC325_12050 [Candidatus Bathyarchaeia archaeon]|jgi:hypothetical protein